MTLIELLREIASHLGHTQITPSQVGSTATLTDATGSSPLSSYDSKHLFNNTWASTPSLVVRRVNEFTPEDHSLSLSGPLVINSGDLIDLWSYVPPVKFGLNTGIKEYLNRVLNQCYKRNLVPMGLTGVGSYTGIFSVNANVYKSTTAIVSFISYGAGDITVSATGMTSEVFDVTTPGVYSRTITLPSDCDLITISGDGSADIDCLSVRPGALKWFFYSPLTMVEALEVWSSSGSRSEMEATVNDGEVATYTGDGLVMMRGYEAYPSLALPSDTTDCSVPLAVAGTLALIYEEKGEKEKALGWRKIYNSLRRFLPRPKKDWMVVP